MTIRGVHPYAEKFPMLGEAELAELAESIAENGLRNPIVLTPDGLILDGRNRSAACERAGVSPTTIVYEGDDLAEYVIDCNSSRRHMSTGARAMATAAWQNAGSPSAPRGCAMTALRPPRRGACRAVSFTSASASLAPTVGQRATPVHDRAGAQDRTQLLPQEEQR